MYDSDSPGRTWTSGRRWHLLITSRHAHQRQRQNGLSSDHVLTHVCHGHVWGYIRCWHCAATSWRMLNWKERQPTWTQGYCYRVSPDVFWNARVDKGLAGAQRLFLLPYDRSKLKLYWSVIHIFTCSINSPRQQVESLAHIAINIHLRENINVFGSKQPEPGSHPHQVHLNISRNFERRRSSLGWATLRICVCNWPIKLEKYSWRSLILCTDAPQWMTTDLVCDNTGSTKPPSWPCFRQPQD